MSTVTVLERDRVDALTVTPLQTTIGAELSGIDMRVPLSDTLRDQIKAAFLKYKCGFFRDQTTASRQHLDYAKRFGRIYTPPFPAEKLIDGHGESGLHRILA